MRHTPTVISALLLLLPAGGCAAGQKARVADLEARVKSLEAKYAIAASHFDEIERLNQISYALQDRVEAVSVEQERLMASVGEAAADGTLRAPERYSFESTPEPASEPAQPRAAVPKKKPVQDSSPPVDQAAAEQSSAQALYTQGYDLLTAKSFDQASTVFLSVVEQYPKDDLADNALYWLGEIEYTRKNYRTALQFFERVEQAYPAGNKVPDALLKQSFAWGHLGDTARAREIAQRLVQDYPWSAAAEKASAAQQ